MSKIGVFIADGCEEVEALAVVDILRRAEIEVEMISITGRPEVTGSHQITFAADAQKNEVNYSQLDGIFLPGGMPGTLHLKEDETVQKVIAEFAEAGKLVAAICAAPSVLGEAGLLKGKNATCYPGFEEKLLGAVWKDTAVVCDGNIMTSRGMGTAIRLGLAMVSYLDSKSKSEKIEESIILM